MGEAPTSRLLLACPDQPGLIARVSGFLAEAGLNIVDVDQHSSAEGRFFMRMVFDAVPAGDLEALERRFAHEIGDPFEMEFELSETSRRKRVAVMVSREDHCLSDLLWRWRNGDLGGELVAVIANHRDHADQVTSVGLPFHHVPVDPENRAAAERRVLELVDGVDLLVLARYMQILSEAFLRELAAPAINIHHSFLPAFVGADPYHRAYERGVKLIGATALRHRRARRRPDHRPGRHPRRPPRRGHRHDPARPRRRAPGARPGRDGPPRRSRPPRRRPHDRLLSRPLLGSQASGYAWGMEQATLRQPRATTASTRPPGSRAPSFVQAVRYLRDPLGFLPRYRKRYGDIFTVHFPFFGRIVYVASPELVKEVFTGAPGVFHAGEANATVLEPALGPNSVLTLDDEPHLRQRKLLLPPFHGDRIRRYGELIEAATRREMESWPVGKPFSLRPSTQRITLSVILRAVFGISDESRVDRATELIDAFSDRVTTITRFPALRRDLGPFSPWRRFLAARGRLDDFVYEEIALRRSEGGGEERDDVLSLLLRAHHDDGTPMSDAELRDELLTVIGAGHETTATALAWAMERLLRTPRVLDRLRDSVAAGEDDYLDATVRETLRIRPVIIDVARKLTAPARVGNYDLPSGTFVVPAIAGLHYREDLYPEPQEFRPERFLEGKADNYAWIPFGGGVRRCVGAAFAEFEMRTVLREIVSRAELRAPDPAPEKVRTRNITLTPAKGTRVVLERPISPVQR
jgi:cytochrome P450 family 135